MKKTVFVFSALIVALLLLFKLSEYTYLSGNISIEIAIGTVAIVFFIVGIYINKKSLKKEKIDFIDHQKIEELGISKREYEVLVQISKGFSNKEIADVLFLSESTIKTHVSNLLVKLDSKRRTQAIQKAKDLHILPV
ncbi:MAG TPA: helix-turn-helix transcriptional regulator [Muricauda sp.]|uniref:Response regulator transcription factor n=1 Tax=Flagellimonas aurea TaxID=2915619 RepID=A0ABS3G803_9FLAO|nr:LuxR C-terminal-related transcriptional regulator [Allomuricauda aurea]MBO0355549.1 response regulator transcription factor [Allomuricauda aurea]HBU78722.1 helix-turn-helix transcriptional regulator [Allomuricauda sp.]